MLRRMNIWSVILFSPLLFSCDEELPPRVIEDFFEPVFVAGDTVEVQIVDTQAQAGTLMVGEGFVVGLRNRSDEILESEARVRGTMNIWSLDDSTFHRSLFFEEASLSAITIMPETTFTVSVVWDQRDDSCRFAFRTLDQFDTVLIAQNLWFRGLKTFRFRASGSVQLFSNVETKNLPEVEFARTYIFNFFPSPEFLMQVKCNGF